MQPFLAVKLDILGSKKIENRSEVQVKLLGITEKINEYFTGAIRSKFVVTHGDEGQGLLKVEGAPELIGIVERYLDALEPVKLRFGVGFGAINTELQPLAIGMDGEAWHHAKAALDSAEKGRASIQFRGFGGKYDLTLSGLANLLLFARSRWTKEQRMVVPLLETRKTQSAVAEELGVSDAAISKRISAAGWHAYRDGREALAILLQEAVARYQQSADPRINRRGLKPPD